MTRKELIERLMNVAENYKEGYIYSTGALTDIGVLVDEYTETVVKNCSIPDDVERSEQSCKHPDSCAMGYYNQIGDYYCSKCQKTGLQD